MSLIERGEHCGPVPEAAWAADKIARRDQRQGRDLQRDQRNGLDNWTMDLDQYDAMRDLILEMIDNDSDEDGTVLLNDVVAAAQDRYGNHELFPKGRLTNYVRYTKVDLEARCEIERIPRSSPERITRSREG
jgi:hypothetical protein